jgi:electron transfer flavoprotein beta subunit
VEIVVLLKQVPATESMITIAEDGVSINTADLKWVISPYDEFAVEEALRIKEAQGGKVTILTVGPDKATEAIRTALAMGADEGILINDPAAQACDGLGIAKILAAALKSMPYDLIIAGQRAVDDDNFLVGTAVAEFLGIPNISIINHQEISDGKIRCRRTVEGGIVVLESNLPALLTTQRGLNEPRYASLPGIMKAKKKPLATKSLADIGLAETDLGESKTKIISMQKPPERGGGRVIDGETAAEKAATLVKLLAEEAKVI